MPEILQYGFMQRALLAGAMIGTIAPVIGGFLVLRRLSLIAAHPAPRAGEPALASFLAGGRAGAVGVIGLAGGFNVGLFTYLFGAITAVQPRDLWVILILGLVVLGAVAVLYKELFAITFDEQGARVQGLPVEGLNLLLTVLVAVTVVVAMRIVGILLTSALIVIPAVTALRLARNFRSALWMAVACSLVTVLAGITASFYLDIPASGAIVLGGILLFAGASLLGPRR